MKKTGFLLLLSILGILFSFIPQKSTDYSKDFLEFWTTVKNNYAYFSAKTTDWEKVKTVYLPLAEAAKDRKELITLFEHALEELYDPHFSLNTNLQSSTRLVPTGLDLWAEWIKGKAIITEVRMGFSANIAGIKPGMEILSINSEPILTAVHNRIGKCVDSTNTEARNFALRQLLAGTYLQSRIIQVSYNGMVKTINIDQSGNMTDHFKYAGLLEHRLIRNDIGYIRINNSLGETDLVKSFDSALLNFKNTRTLILDLRETPSGGNSIVARGIISRFISSELPYQKHVLPEDERDFKVKRSWIEIVSPRGPFTYQGKLIVLVNHWTGSMGEGIAVGFDAWGKAKIVGTKMAGLVGAINGFQTSNAKIPYSFPDEQLFHVNGQPRELYSPSILVDLLNNKYKEITDPVLEEAISMTKR